MSVEVLKTYTPVASAAEPETTPLTPAVQPTTQSETPVAIPQGLEEHLLVDTITMEHPRFMEHPLFKEFKALDAELAAQPSRPVVWRGTATITPKFAAQILQHNAKFNRAPNRGKIKEYVRAMLRQDWAETGEPVIFADDPVTNNLVMLNGQNRMKACVSSKTSFVTAVTIGIDISAFDKMDSGKTRSPDSILKKQIDGPIGHAMRSLAHFLEPLIPGSQLGVSDYRAILRVYPAIDTATTKVANVIHGTHPLCRNRAFVTLLYFFVMDTRPECATEFLTQLESGSDLPSGSPLLLLRKILTQVPKAKKVPADTVKLEWMATKAFIHYLNGKTNVASIPFHKPTALKPLPVLEIPEFYRLPIMPEPVDEETVADEEDAA